MFVSELLEVLRSCNTLAERAVLTALIGRMNKEYKAFPSFSTIAKDSGVSLRTAKSVVVELERRGLLARQVESGIRTTYTIRLDHIEHPIDMVAPSPAPVVAKNATTAKPEPAPSPAPVCEHQTEDNLSHVAKPESIAAPLPVVVHETHDSAPQPALPIICAPQTATPQQGELLPVPPKKKRGGAKTNGHRIPDNWYLTKKLGMWAKKKYGLDDDTIRHETEKFIDHWKASASETAWKSDWNAAWRNWIRKHAESGGTANGNRYNNLPQQKSKTRMAMERLISMSGGDFEIPF